MNVEMRKSSRFPRAATPRNQHVRGACWFFLALALAGVSTLKAEAPKGWFEAGNNRQGYESGAETPQGKSRRIAFLRSKKKIVPGFGTLMQTISARHYRNKRVRLSAEIRSEGVLRWAGMWMRVDGKTEGKSLAFDNMQDRPIRGTRDWRRYEVVLDVGEEAEFVAFGFLLDGGGQIWIDQLKLEIVDDRVALTDRLQPSVLPEKPVNLGFGDS